MGTVNVLLGIFLVAAGLLNLFAHDFVWALHILVHSAQEGKPERTKAWDYLRAIEGAAIIPLGVLLVLAGLVG